MEPIGLAVTGETLNRRIPIDESNDHLTIPFRVRVRHYEHLIPVEDAVSHHGIPDHVEYEDPANR